MTLCSFQNVVLMLRRLSFYILSRILAENFFMIAEITKYIEQAPSPQQEIMKLLRNIIHENVDGVVESYKWSRPIFSTEKDFAYLLCNKNHVNLGISRNFDKLNDPHGYLEGTGKTMRHIKLKSVEEVGKLPLKEWLEIITV